MPLPPLSPSRRACALAATALLALACGRAPAPEGDPERRVFLLNLAPERVLVDGQATDLHRAKPPATSLRTIECAGDFRRALVIAPGTDVAFHTALRAGARLSFALGCSAARPPQSAYRFLVLARGESGAERVLFEHTLAPPGEGGAPWHEVLLELPAADEPDLVLRTELVAGGKPEPLERVPGWANPQLLLPAAARSGAPAPVRSVVVFLIDTLRRDHLGLYGRAPSPSPHLDALAAQSLVFEQAHAASSWTKASVASLLTSRLPSQHGAEDHPDRLAASERTLGHVFRAAGYRTAAFGFNTWIFNPKFHFGEGFDTFVEVNDRSSDRETRSDAVVAEALDWVERNQGRPFFLYVHSIDPHAPYEPLPEVLARFEPQGYAGTITGAIEDFQQRRASTVTPEELAHLRALYDAEIAFNDEQVARLIEGLRALGLWEECTFVVTADHGEEFLEHGSWSHGGTLYQEQLLVPLLLKPPRSARLAPARAPQAVSLLDVAPTLCQLSGIASEDEAFLGRSLLTVTDADERLLVSELARSGNVQYALRRGDWKYIAGFAPRRREELFDLAQDPGEQRDLSAAAPELLARFRRDLQLHSEASAGDGLFLWLSGDGAPVEARIELRAQAPLSSFRLLGCELDQDRCEVLGPGVGTGLALSLRGGGDDRSDALHLRTSLASLTVRVELAGEPLAPERIRLGAAGASPAANPFELRLDDPALVWEGREPPGDEGGILCRIWLRPRTEVELDEQELMLLRKLGY